MYGIMHHKKVKIDNPTSVFSQMLVPHSFFMINKSVKVLELFGAIRPVSRDRPSFDGKTTFSIITERCAIHWEWSNKQRTTNNEYNNKNQNKNI